MGVRGPQGPRGPTGPRVRDYIWQSTELTSDCVVVVITSSFLSLSGSSRNARQRRPGKVLTESYIHWWFRQYVLTFVLPLSVQTLAHLECLDILVFLAWRWAEDSFCLTLKCINFPKYVLMGVFNRCSSYSLYVFRATRVWKVKQESLVNRGTR